MDEAVRLLKVATYAAVTDASGKIDLEKVTTGFGQGNRDRQNICMQAIREALKAEGPELSRTRLMEVVNTGFVEAKLPPMDDGEMFKMLREAESGGVISRRGRTNNASIRLNT